ncbi:thiamine pyrophosphokinase [Clostridium acetireducens DSM 10703]|jgi:thiamine pyrophosphokinase|uniref:Thiamine diphosphokinase n=1 Tax=Clostridium acetireducens DSM 10703 TaxID=1121290 RepID=A0A1E8F208_9CLOT|nr:thiamine diphosphokinase [Clostridium acetireducens]OFI07677.1 thiamine pyrophosphokinase [Clostridium acetireducens DSM 10703]
MKTVIVAGGSPPSFDLINKELEDATYLVCADSGANCLYNYNIKPHYLIGDFDSIDKNVFDFYKKESCIIEMYPKDKDDTDTELCIKKAIELFSDEIVLLGCTGSRLDHILGNIGLLLRCLNLNIKASIRDNNNIIFISNKPLSVKGEKGEDFSIQAYCNEVKGLTLRGCKYELTNYNLKIGDPLTISNQFLDDLVHIDFKTGIILIMFSKDN